jgi:hypothetical protein
MEDLQYYKLLDMPESDWKHIKDYILFDVVLNKDTPIVSHAVNLNNHKIKLLLKNLISATLAQYGSEKCEAKSVILFGVPPHSKVNIHVDGYTADRKDSSNFALNIPIQHCEQGVMHWYKGAYTLEEGMTPEKLKHLKIVWADEPEIAHSKIIDSPCIVRVDIPHNVENLSDHYRLILSIRFAPDLAIR